MADFLLIPHKTLLINSLINWMIYNLFTSIFELPLLLNDDEEIFTWRKKNLKRSIRRR